MTRLLEHANFRIDFAYPIAELQRAIPEMTWSPINGMQLEIGHFVEVEVPIWRLDDYRSRHNLPAPELLKLDVQGFELDMLNGASGCSANVKAVITAVLFVEYYEGQCFFNDVVSYLAQHSFFVTALGEQTTGAVLEHAAVLFVRQP